MMIDVERKFFDRITPEPNSGCWLWLAAENGTGYGKFYVDGKMQYVHRWAYEYFIRKIPVGMHIDHLCRVRCCANPTHLEPVTRSENTRRGNSYRFTKFGDPRCRYGHLMPDHNLYINPKGYRECRTCRRLRREGMKEMGNG